jgi:hypothetical protein
MLGGLLLVVCVILQFHCHDSIPWFIWVLALIAQCVAFGEPAMRSAAAKKNFLSGRGQTCWLSERFYLKVD